MEITGQLIRDVWQKATPIIGQDDEHVRLDAHGVWIRLKDYNNVDSVYGWTILQIKPAGDEGFKDLSNLMPVHTLDNPVPLAGYNPPLDKVFNETII